MNLVSYLWRRIKLYKYEFLMGTILRVLADLCVLYQAYGLALIINYLARHDYAYGKMLMILGVWCFLMVFRQILLYFGKPYIYTIAEKIEVDVLQEGLEHVISLDAAWHEDENTGNKIKRIQNSAEAYNTLIRIWVNNLIEICVNFVGILWITSHIDKRVTGFIVFYIVVYYIISFSLLKKARKKSNLVNLADEHATGILYESVNSIRTVKLLSLKEYILLRYKEATDKVISAFKNSVVWFQVRIGSTNAWTHICVTVTIGFIAYGVIHGRYELGFIALFYGYFGSIRDSVSELSNISESIVLSEQKIARYEDFKSIELVTENLNGKIPFPQSWNRIILNDLSFSYKDQEALSCINLTITKGEKIGIVGLSGAGKSTLFKILLKEREDYTGNVLIDATSLRTIAAPSYRAHLGVVLQDTEVFNASLRDNIIIGSAYDEDHFNTVVEVAHIKDLADKLKDGIMTHIGEKGIKLSGGERQRLGIARALYKKPEILLLDEATSHLDLESEAKIKDSLHKAFNGLTAVVIAHRLTTIREMDRILVIEGGKIIEEGSFTSLYKAQSRFYDLWEKQKLI